MGKGDIIKKFLNAGLQLNKDALDYFTSNEESIDVFLEKFAHSKDKSKIVTAGIIQKILEDTNKPVEIKITEFKITEFKQQKKKISVSDLAENLLKRYNLLKNILEEKTPTDMLLSINKITPSTKHFSIICMVVSTDEKTITVEDATGELTLQIDTKEEILPDDVIGLVCEQKEGRFVAKEVIWPDIPLKREIKKSKGKNSCVFLGSDFNVDKLVVEDVQTLIFVFGSKKEFPLINKHKAIFLDDIAPSIIEIEDVNILVLSTELIEKYKKHWKDPESIVKNLLKKRDINPIHDSVVEYEQSVLAQPPDIAVLPAKSENVVNYKGTTIISVSNNGGYHIDLSTREVKKL